MEVSPDGKGMIKVKGLSVAMYTCTHLEMKLSSQISFIYYAMHYESFPSNLCYQIFVLVHDNPNMNGSLHARAK